jgi:phosphoribosylpyrophosphate synthetase
MGYWIKRPDILLVSENDILGTMIARAMECGYVVPFRREYHDDGAPAPKVDLNYTLTEYDKFRGKKVLTLYRRRQLPDRSSVARHLSNYPRVVFNLMDKDIFGADELDVLYPYWINGRADHNPRTDEDDAVKIRDKGRGMEYKFDAVMFKAAGASRIFTYHPHFHRGPGRTEVEGIEVICLNAVPSMVRYAKNELEITEDCLVVSPDLKPARAGKYDIALEFAKVAGLDSSHLEMSRTDDRQKRTKTKIDADGKDVLIVDDIGSTVGTVRTATQNIKNASRIDILFVHAVLPYSGLSAVNELLGSDDYPVRSVAATHTIASDISRIPIHEPLVDFYREHEEPTLFEM